MPTLILGGMSIEDPQTLRKAAMERGWRVVEIATCNFTSGFLSIKDPVIYAGPGMAEKIAKALNVKLVEVSPGWLSSLPYDFVKREIVKDSAPYYKLKDSDYPKFIKPCIYKYFEAKVYNEFPYELKVRPNDSSSYYVGDIYIQEPVEWEVEYRCFVSQGKIQTLAPYRRNMKTDKHTQTDEEVSYCHRVVEQLNYNNLLPKTGALDIGMIKGRGWAVIELNGAYGSGIYKLTDPEKVLDVLQETTIK